MTPCRSALAFALCAMAGAQQADPCAAEEDPLRRVECHAARLQERAAGSGGGWHLGEETDPITDEPSAVLRTRAEEPVRNAAGNLAWPSLTLTCWRGREFLAALDAGEGLALPAGQECGDADAGPLVTYRLGSDTPVRRPWSTTGPACEDAWLDSFAGALILARALAEEDPGRVLFRWGTAGGGERTASFRLDGLAALLGRLETACGAGKPRSGVPIGRSRQRGPGGLAAGGSQLRTAGRLHPWRSAFRLQRGLQASAPGPHSPSMGKASCGHGGPIGGTAGMVALVER